jgi:LuxR family maltose regulon positive regulatory protein
MPKQATTLAKLSRPRLHDTVPRERLFRRLDALQALPVTLVAAPPGAGKTTLVASYLESRQLGGIWFQVDAGDIDPATFFYFLGRADAAMPGRARRARRLPLLTPEYLPDLPGFARRFFRELFARLPAPSTIVFDNFQEAGDDGELHSALVAALEEVPAGIRVFLVSRHPPPDRYARLAANRALGLLDWEEIKLTAEEALDLLSAARLPQAAAAAQALHVHSGGWAAGLVLLAEQLRRGHVMEAARAPESMGQVFAYFAGQLFDRTPPEDRRMLMQMSFLPAVSDRQAVALTGNEASRTLLDHLYRRHLFTDLRRGTDSVYVFHSLFRAFLQHRATEELAAADQIDTARRAAALLEASGEPDGAMPLYLSVGDFDAAEALVLAAAAPLIGQGRWKVVVDWIESIPADLVAKRPWVLHWLGTAQIGVDPPRARAVLGQAHAVAVAHGEEECAVLCAAGMVESYFLEYSDFMPITRWIAALDAMFSPAFQFGSRESELRAQSAMLIACTYRQPDHPDIDRCVQRVRELLGTGIDVNLRVSAGTYLTIYGSFTGHLDEGKRAAAIVAPLLADPGVHIFRRIFGWAVLCWYSCSASDFDLGDRAVNALMGIARDDGMHIAERFACIIGYFLDMDRRGIDAGRERIERFEKIMIPSQPYEAASIVNMKSWFGVYTGDADYARKYSGEAVRLYEEAGSIPHILMGFNGHVWACTEAGEEADARSAIAAHRRWSSTRNMAWAQWAPDAAEAMLALRAGDEATLRDRLKRLFAHERHLLDQYGHQFAWCRGWAATLTAAALERGIEAERARRFVHTFRLEAPGPTVAAWPWPVRITTLGRFEVCVNDVPLTFSHRAPRRTLMLLKVLIALGGRDVRDHLLIDALWPQEEGDVARDAFRVALHRLRKLLGKAESVVVDDGRVSLDSAACWVDAIAFEAASLQPDGSTTALRLYEGAFLPGDADEPWTVGMRDRLRQKFLRQVDDAGTRLERDRRFDEACALYVRALDADSTAESPCRGLMRSHAALGRVSEALGGFARLCRALAATHGIQPSAATVALYESIVRGAPRA